MELMTMRHGLVTQRMPVSFLNMSINESDNKAITDPATLAKLFPVIGSAIEGAIGIETHSNRYFADMQTKQFFELLGGICRWQGVCSCQIWREEFVNGNAALYVVVCQDITKAEFMEMDDTDLTVRQPISPSAFLSIPSIAANVNTPDLLRHLPDGLLNDGQRRIKYEALAKTIESIPTIRTIEPNALQ